VTFNTNIILNNWLHTTGTAIFTGNVAGTHFVTYTATTNRSGNPTSQLELRCMLNGSEISGSQNGNTLTANTAKSEVSNSFLLSITSGDAFKVQFTADDTNGQLAPIGTNATVRPSIRLSIAKV
jgi:hypothetical protein